jgi:glycolate oxidase FAD binding subunit
VNAALESLGSELGAGTLSHHDPIDLDGVPVAATLSPADGEALARAVEAIGRAGLAAVPRGSGLHLALGNPPERADLFLSCAALHEVTDFEPAEGVCRAGAGTRLSTLCERVGGEGWELPLEGPGAATLGGVLAAAAVGPRSQHFGPARDAVLGLGVVLGSGERTHCGGRVVKNVTGYDLAKLYTGSVGSLGVIESAWLRLRPRPAVVRTLERPLHGEGEEDGTARALDAARRPTTRACVLLPGEAMVVELGGDAAAVAADAEAIGGEEVDASRIDALAALQRGGGGADEVRFRIAVLAGELAPVTRSLHRAGISALAYPGSGLVYAWGEASGAEPLLRAVDAAAGLASGPLRCEVAPPAVKRRRGDVFGASPAEAALFRALKRRFDPDGVLSPGRMVLG